MFPQLRWREWKSLSCQQRQLCEDQARKHPSFWGQQSVSQPSPALNPINLKKQWCPRAEELCLVWEEPRNHYNICGSTGTD